MRTTTILSTIIRALAGVLLLIGLTGPGSAQELLQNRSFEAPVAPANGNNFYVTIPNWALSNVTPTQAAPFNVILPWAGYANNPTAPPTGGGAQYLDVNAASGTLSQTVTVPGNGMIDFGGWFSVRDNQQALTGLTINIRNASNTVIATISTSFAATDPIGLWKQASSFNVPVAAGSYTFEALIPNPANFDLATLVFKPALQLTKISTAFSDPSSGTTNPKLIPGALADYTLNLANAASYTVDSGSVSLADTTPANMDLVVSDIGGAGSGPALFVQGAPSSTLTYGFAGLASGSDDVEFSSNGGASFTYVPTPNANGVDAAVTTIRLRPKGTMAANSSLAFRVRYRVR